MSNVVHADYGMDRTACGESGRMDKNPDHITCPNCWRKMWHRACDVIDADRDATAVERERCAKYIESLAHLLPSAEAIAAHLRRGE